MKTLLLISFTFILNLSYGQKRLTAYSDYVLNPTNNSQSIDSFSYSYSSWQGSLTEFEPKLVFMNETIFPFLELPIIHCNSFEEYNGNSHPLSLSESWTNTLTNNSVVTSLKSTTNSDRTLFTYNNSGQRMSEVQQSYNGSNWISSDSISTTFDSFGRKTREIRFSFLPSISYGYLDSFFYDPSNFKVVRSIRYVPDFSVTPFAAKPDAEALITYNSTGIDYIDLYYPDGSNNFLWQYRYIYSYSGQQIDEYSMYQVISNAPSISPLFTVEYDYNTFNQLIETREIDGLTNNLNRKYNYLYDSDGFTTKETAEIDYPTVGLNFMKIKNFYFESTAGLNDEKIISIKLFPNPTQNTIQISAEGVVENVRVLNSSGQILLEKNSGELNIEHLPAGTYLIIGSTNEGSFRKTVVKR